MGWDSIRRIDDDAEHVSKFVFSKGDGVAEAVLYRYPDYRTRTVICCSTQSGCPVGCRFCGAGDYFVRNLTADEIVSQPVHLLEQVGMPASEIGRLQIMFMSMGEPMLNQRQLLLAIWRLHRLYPEAALLISTSGPQLDYGPIVEMSQEIETIGLQFSVHESTDAAREALIPFRAKLGLADIAVVGGYWHRQTGRRPFFNYCAHGGNSTEEDADRLVRLFPPWVWCATVSVICERSEGLPSTNERQRSLATSFSEKLVARGYDVRVFDPAGQDTIGGGCGQLWFVQEWMREHPEAARPSVGRGFPSVHTPQLKHVTG